MIFQPVILSFLNPVTFGEDVEYDMAPASSKVPTVSVPYSEDEGLMTPRSIGDDTGGKTVGGVGGGGGHHQTIQMASNVTSEDSTGKSTNSSANDTAENVGEEKL